MPTINRDGVNIYYEVHGSGPPLLLTHGYSSTSGMWQGQIAALSKHHKLVLWDMEYLQARYRLTQRFGAGRIDFYICLYA